MTDPVPSKEQCKCSMRQSVLGDGCEVCNPKLALEYANEQIADLKRENVRWENAHKILLSENERFRRPAHEREPPHCASCACGMEPEQPNAIRALWNKAVIVQDGNRATVAFETADEAEAAFDYIHQLGSIAQTTEGGRDA